MGILPPNTLGTLTGGALGSTPATSADNSQNGLYSQMASQYSQYFPQIMNMLYPMAQNPLSLSSNSQLGAYNDQVATQGQQAVNTAQDDLMGRGFTGANTLTPSVVGQMRNSQAGDVASYGRNLGIQNTDQRFSDLMSLLNTVGGQGNTAANGFGQIANQQTQQQNSDVSALSGIANIASMFM